jgi:hypothetical protein
MNVFVIPVGRERYELYCEQPFASDPPAETADHSLFARLKRRLEDLLRRAEQWEEQEARERPRGLLARLHDRTMAWVAERVAEQRLLWNLRRETTVVADYPDDLTPEQAHTLIVRILQKDFERHQNWVWVDGALFLVTFVGLGPLFLLIPGIANLPALFFGFRTVAHWYSRGGARHGLRSVTWNGRCCPPLTELRQMSGLPPQQRDERLQAIALQLGLTRLPSFYERVSKPSL